jgi:hypothetical protein
MVANTDLNDDYNTLMRLKNLREVSSRLRGRGDDQIKEMLNPDIVGTPAEDILPAVPMPDLGDEPISQNPTIDVRANELNIPGQTSPAFQSPGFSESYLHAGKMPQITEPESEPGLLSRIGAGIKNYFNPPKFEMPPISGEYLHAGKTPPVPPSETPNFIPQASPERTPFPWEKQTQPEFLTPSQMEFYENMHPALREKNTKLKERYEATKANQGAITPHLKEQEEVKKGVDEAVKNPGQIAVPGVSSMILNDPVMKTDFEEIVGTNYEPQLAEQLSKYENVIFEATKGIDDALSNLDESERMIRDRMRTGQLTTQDKILMGISLFLPMIAAGLVGGKEAAIGALGGGAAGLAKGLSEREKMARDDEATILELAKQKAAQNVKKAELGLSVPDVKEKLRKSVPIDEKNELFKGMQKVTIQTPQGIVEGLAIKPGIIADPKFIYDKESKKNTLSNAEELSNSTQAVTRINELTDNIIDILDKTELPGGILSQAFQSVLLDKAPSISPKLGTMIDYKGKKANSAVLLNNQLGLLKDAYRLSKKMRAFTNTVQEHTSNIMGSPYGEFMTANDLIDQMLSLRENAQSALLDEAGSKGFLVEPIISKLVSENKPSAEVLTKRYKAQRYKEEMQ